MNENFLPANFDNSATTFPKPRSVITACNQALSLYGGNPGRSGHNLSIKTAQKVYEARESIASFFGATPENVVFTLNCTHALNMAIKGIMMSGGHVIFSSLEHNSVARVCYALGRYGCRFSIFDVDENDDVTLQNLKSLITDETKCIVSTIASNVTGQILPYKRIARLCSDKNICFIADASQAAGILPIRLSEGINILCTAGHKGLYGPTGTGLMITDGKFVLDTLLEGGTGATSEEMLQTPFLPERFESGTLNTVGIMGLKAGVEFVKSKGLMNIYRHEQGLCNMLLSELSKEPSVIIYRNPDAMYLPIVAFNVKNKASADVAQYLSDNGLYLRSGLHCASVAHRFNGTIRGGTLRFSPSVFNNTMQVKILIKTLKKYLKNAI